MFWVYKNLEIPTWDLKNQAWRVGLGLPC